MCESNKSSILNVKLFYGMVRPQNTYSVMIENENFSVTAKTIGDQT